MFYVFFQNELALRGPPSGNLVDGLPLVVNREAERQRDRETERQRDRETERQRDRETERER